MWTVERSVLWILLEASRNMAQIYTLYFWMVAQTYTMKFILHVIA